jgi:nucleoside 2-deoxyribosyltransferase
VSVTRELASTVQLTISDSGARPRVYLAGPEVFLKNAVDIGQRKKVICNSVGLVGVFPIDVDTDVDNLPPQEAALMISKVNEELIRSCCAIIANITPFRGISADVGTVYEMGYAAGLGMPVFAYTNVSERFAARTVQQLGLKGKLGEHGRLCDENDMLIENWNLMDNLMLEGGVAGSGGAFVIEDAPVDEIFTWLDGFRRCVELAADALSSADTPNNTE